MQLPASGTIARPSSGATRVGAVSRWQAGYAGVVLFACALTFLVITWGGLVRAEGAGLACPDWPLCNGHVIPDADKLVLIEWGHRLVAAVLGFAILYTAIGAWRWHRRNRAVLAPATLALVFVGIQIILGAVTVTADLSPQIVSAHLGTSLLVFASLLVTAANIHRWPRAAAVTAPLRLFPLIASFGALVTYGLMLTGSYVVGSGAGAACRSWPLCDGLPGAGNLVQVHMFHRAAVLLVGGVVLYTAYQAWRLRAACRPLALLGAAAVAVYLAQALVGAGNIWFGLVPAVQVAHLATAAAMWAVMVLLATLAWRAARVEG